MVFVPVYIFILAVTIIIDYSAAIWIENSRDRWRSFFLVISIISTCLVLFVFKYSDFFITNVNVVAEFLHWNYSLSLLKLILPIGLSFHTFQSLSYVIEVYRGNQKTERHFGIYALYVMFYPQLVAGPIERPQNLLRQFYSVHTFDCQRVADGLKLMLWGMFKKIVIADRLAVAVNQVYGSPREYTGLPLILSTVFFAFQIYCDFSGYTDIAIGAAQVMGFRLMDNFNRPYFSKSIGEFWRRWHISLSTWFRDYLYIPLGGNRVAGWRWQLNLFITFVVSGLWHGANWTYIVWGALNCFYMTCSIWTRALRQSFCRHVSLNHYPVALKYLRVAATFSLVCVAWIFFRAKTISDAWYIFTHLFVDLHQPILLPAGYFGLGLSSTELAIAVLSLGIMESVHVIQRHGSIRHMLAGKPAWVRWSIYYLLFMWILNFGIFESKDFIYFQF